MTDLHVQPGNNSRFAAPRHARVIAQTDDANSSFAKGGGSLKLPLW